MAMATGSVQSHTARFAAACDVLSRYVKAAAVEARPAASTVGVLVLPLMPGADLSTHQEEPEAAEAGPAPAPSAPQQLTISYGGRVVVLDDVPADRAAELLRLAAAAQAGAPVRVLPAKDDLLPMARKASLRQFMEKRKGRVAARGSPYSRPDTGAAAVSLPPDHLTLKL